MIGVGDGVGVVGLELHLGIEAEAGAVADLEAVDELGDAAVGAKDAGS